MSSFTLLDGITKASSSGAKHTRPILDAEHHDPKLQLPARAICDRVVALAQVMSEKKFYPYQTVLAHRIVESLLLREGEVLTALISRQSGKTECLGAIIAAIFTVLPFLARKFPNDWKLNITDDRGVYRGFAKGITIGIYAPRLDQSDIMFNRVKLCLETDSGKQVLKELNMGSFDVYNGNSIRLKGSRLLCESASEQSKIEGETHQLLILEESQDISDMKVKKSLSPMVSATMGSIVKIGTATNRRCDFYTTCKHNQRLELIAGKKFHFFFNYKVCQRYNSMYRKFIEKEKSRLGEDSDEFRMSYNCDWLFERGMFVTSRQLFNPQVAQVGGAFSIEYPVGLPKVFSNYSIVAGIDWGKVYDSTVLTLVAVDWNNPEDSGNIFREDGEHVYTLYKKHVVCWAEWLGDNYEHQFWQIFDLLGKYPGLARVVTDSNTCGSPIYDRLDAMLRDDFNIDVMPFNFNMRLKSDAYKSLYADICGQRLTFPASKAIRGTIKYRKFTNQMLDLQKEYKAGLMSVKHPEEKGAHDDYCFPPCAPVVTSEGNKEICNVKVGDLVLTRKGYKRVSAAFSTGTRKVIRRFNLVGTPSHPFYCVNKGTYVRLDSLVLGDIVLVCHQEQKSSTTTVLSSHATQPVKEDNLDFVTEHTLNGKNIIDNTHQSQNGLNWLKSVLLKLKKRLCCQGITKQKSLETPQVLGSKSYTAKSHILVPVPVQHASGDSATLQWFESNSKDGKCLTEVLNLTVEDENEYVCQDVLVHNCDSLCMAAWGANLPRTAKGFQISDTNFFLR